MTNDYRKFIRSKQRRPKACGFDVDPATLNASLFDWQRRAVAWALKRGRAALFEECGLGKTLQQLAWAEQVHKHTGRPVIVHCPVGVRQQTRSEAVKFGIGCEVAVVDDPQDLRAISLVNYEKLHRFDAESLGGVSGVVLDESSILKSFTGSTKRLLCEAYERTPYRLACTATPAPNDHMELGNHADFLGVMPSNEMLSRWFINDTMKAGGYRLRGHAESDFWDWVASWAVCVSRPSDLGGDDSGFNLPELRVQRHLVEADETPVDGLLFNTAGISATTVHEAKRLSNESRCRRAAELVAANQGPHLIWCDTNYEADRLAELIPDAVEIRGSHSESQKEQAFVGFASGEFATLITKPSVAGFGMNWQHCSSMIFAGLSFSFEQYYQAVRRCWRFGQSRPVDVHIVLADCEHALQATVARKESDHSLMQAGMAAAIRRGLQDGPERIRDRYKPTRRMSLPGWISREEACV